MAHNRFRILLNIELASLAPTFWFGNCISMQILTEFKPQQQNRNVEKIEQKLTSLATYFFEITVEGLASIDL